MLNLRFSAKARKEFEDAAHWYEDRRAGLGAQFVLAVEAKLDSICKRSESYPIVYKHYRRALVRRFPFAIFFEINSNAAIILAVFHTSRKPLNQF